MDQLFDRLGNLLRSLFQDDEEPQVGSARRRASLDPDMDAAWEELDEFLKTGKNSARSSRYEDYQRRSTGGGTGTAGERIPEEIKRDYANLEVPLSADLETVRKAYHRLIRQYHPDRFANNPEKFKNATEITQKINQSYQRIKRYRETGKL